MKCDICGRECPSNDYILPEDIRDEKQYCVCISWETLVQCAELSISNVQRLIDDAVLLLKHEKISHVNIFLKHGLIQG